MKKYVRSLGVTTVSLIIMFAVGFVSPSVSTIIGTTVVAEAAASEPKKIFDAMQESSGEVVGSSVRDKVLNLSREVQELVLAIVIGILTSTSIFTGVKFSGAGDDSQAKGRLKNALIYQVLGIVFLASVLSMVKFGLVNLNLF